MPDVNGRPNQLDLETQRTNLMLQETLANLNLTMTRMQSNQERLNLGVKLDAVLDELAASNMSTKRAMAEYNRIAGDMNTSFQQSAQNRESTVAQSAAAAQTGLRTVNAQLEMYSPGYKPPVSEETAVQDFDSILDMHRSARIGLGKDMAAARAAGYFQDPELRQPYFNRQAGYQDTGTQEFAWFNQVRKLADREDPLEIRTFSEFEREMYEESQKAMLNRQISEHLGVKSGMVAKRDFEAIVQPGLSNFAQDYNLALDQAASVVKKMQELNVVSADLHTGRGVEILTAIDRTGDIFKRLSGVLKSTDVNELMAYAARMSNIGHGDFDLGFAQTYSNTRNILGTFRTQQSLAQASAMAQQFEGMFGQDSLAAVNAGAWGARNANIAAIYADGSKFRTGTPQTAAALYTQAVMSQALGPSGLILGTGGGDALAGAERLMNQANTKGAVDFYLNMPEMMQKAQEHLTGPSADRYFRERIQNLQRNFRLSEDEALLSVFHTAEGVNAYKEMRNARERQADEIERNIRLARFQGTYLPGDSPEIIFMRREDRLNEGEIDVSGGLWAQTGIPDWFRENISDPLRRLDSSQSHWSTPDRYNISGIRDESVDYTSNIDNKAASAASDSGTISSVVSSAQTDSARKMTDKLIKQIADGRRPNIRDLQRILMAGTADYAGTGLLDGKREKEVRSYIAKLTPRQALKEIAPRLDKEDPFRQVIEATVDFNAAARRLLSPEQLNRQQLVGTVAASGADIRKDIAGIEWLRDLNTWIDNNQEGLDLVLGGASMVLSALAPVSFGASLAIDAAIMAAPTVLRGTESAAEYLGATLGSEVDIDAIMEATGVNDANVTAFESEVRGYLLAIRALLGTFNYFSSTAAFMTFTKNSERCAQALIEIVNIYSDMIRKKKNAAGAGNQGKKEVYITQEECNGIAKQMTERLWDSWKNQGVLDSNTTIAFMRQTMASIVTALNHAESNVGTMIRKGSSGGLNAEIKSFAANMKDVLDDTLWSDSDVASWRNIAAKANGKEFSNVFLGTFASKDAMLEQQQRFDNVNRLVERSMTGDEESNSITLEFMDRLNNAVLDGKIDSLQADEKTLKAIKKTLGAKGNALEQILRNSDSRSRRTELMDWYDTLEDSGQDVTLQTDQHAMELVDTFMRTAQYLLANEQASDLSRQLYRKMTTGW